jgi:hypothetical protein
VLFEYKKMDQTRKRPASERDDEEPKRVKSHWIKPVEDPNVFADSRKSQTIANIASFCKGHSVDGFDVYFIPYEFDQTRSVDDMVKFVPNHAKMHADGRPMSACAHYLKFLSRGTMVDNPETLIDMRVFKRALFLFRAPSLGFRMQGLGLPAELEDYVGTFRNRADVPNLRNTSRALAMTPFPRQVCERFVIDFPVNSTQREALALADRLSPELEGLARECENLDELVINRVGARAIPSSLDLQPFFAYFVRDVSVDALLSKTKKLVFQHMLAMSYVSQAGLNYLLNKYPRLQIVVNELYLFVSKSTQNVHISHPDRLYVRECVHFGANSLEYIPQADALTTNPYRIVPYEEYVSRSR